MSTYDRSIRQTLRTALRRICGQRDPEPEPPERTAVILNASSRRRNRPATCNGKRAAVYALLLAALLLAPAMPAAAQDAPPTTGAASHSLYLPAIVWTFPSWFTPAELEQAQAAAGYDVEEASMHTNCYLDPSATPPDDLRFSSCEQYLIGNEPTEGQYPPHYIWYLRLNDGKVHAIEVGGTMAAAAATSEAPCYLDTDNEVTCG